MRNLAYAPIDHGYSQCYASSKILFFRINSTISNSQILDYKIKIDYILKNFFMILACFSENLCIFALVKSKNVRQLLELTRTFDFIRGCSARCTYIKWKIKNEKLKIQISVSVCWFSARKRYIVFFIVHFSLFIYSVN